MNLTKTIFALLFSTLTLSFPLAGFAEAGPLNLSGVGIYVSAAGHATGEVGPGVGILLSWKNAPLIGATWSFAQNRQHIGFFADFRVHEGPIENTPLGYSVSGGGYGGLSFKDSKTDVELGVRAPLGINFFPSKRWELFFQFVPMMGVLPELGLRIGADLGFIYHF